MLRRFIPMLLVLALAACLPQPAPPLLEPWTYTDLRAFGENMAAAPPTQDLIAVFSRSLQNELQFRLDMLEVPVRPACDLYLALDTAPGGTRSLPLAARAGIDWDTLLVIPAAGPIRALTPEQQARPRLAVRVQRDPQESSIIISLDSSRLPGTGQGLQFEVFAAAPGSRLPGSRTKPVSSLSQPPPPASVLLAFWDTLPAYTPAQALRRWDGAHTGPFGGRHGLHNLLRAARSRSIPLALLDLKTPAALSALGFLKGTNLVRDMAADGLLILPTAVPAFPGEQPVAFPDWATARAAGDSLQASRSYHLPNSPFLYALLSPDSAPDLIPPSNRVVFVPSSSGSLTSVLRWKDQRVIPVPSQTPTDWPDTASNKEMPFEIRRSLARAARAADGSGGSTILLLGGDLPQTGWGDPAFAQAGLDYLIGHPWIRLLGPADLLAAAPAGEYTPPTTQPGAVFQVGPEFEAALNQASQQTAQPTGTSLSTTAPILQDAWQAYLASFAPIAPHPAQLAALRAQYAGQVGELLAAARWASRSSPMANCSSDLDQDGQAECILASQDFFAVFKPQDGGALIFAFALNQNGSVHQVIGPSSQFISGDSEPDSWDLSRGLAADPSVIPGAFADSSGPYQAAFQGDLLVFSSTSTGAEKSFRLVPGGLLVEYHTPSTLAVRVPVALDPWTRFTPGWADLYKGQAATNSFTWGLPGDAQVIVQSSLPLTASSFNETQELMSSEENPNLDFPPGHFLPFPLAVVEIQGEGDFSVQIGISGNEDE